MHLIAVVLVVYIVFAEWRGINQQRKIDMRWQKNDGSVDFEAIKRWAYLKDIKNL